MKLKKTDKNYEAIGFVELIIAIGIAGIAIVVLMNMASNGMKEAIRHERIDALTRMTTGGALIVRKHAENASDLQGMALEESLASPFEPQLIGGIYGCHEIDSDRGEVNFTTEPYAPDSLLGEESLQRTIIYGEDEENTLGDVYYIAYCVDSVTRGDWQDGSLERSIYTGYVVAGYVNCGNCGLESYKSPVVVTVVTLPED